MAENTEKKATAAKTTTAKAAAPKKEAAPKAKVVEKASSTETKPVVKASAEKTVDARRPYRKTKQGIVVSTKMEKTIVVQVEDRSKHPLYGKVVKKFIKFKAHDEKSEAGMGDVVRIVETRPLSATKRWRLAEIVERSK